MPIIEYNAGECLTVDQNLYNQPPYQALPRIAQEAGISLSKLRGEHVRAADQLEQDLSAKKGIYLTLLSPDQIRSATLQHPHLAKDSFRRWSLYKPEINLPVVADVLSELATAPLWYAYLAAYQEKDFGLPGELKYRQDGQIRFQNRKYYDEEPTPTYPRWLSQEIVRRERAADFDRRKVVLGVEEIFPQDFAGEAKLHPQVEQAVGMRRWRITIESMKQEPTETIRVPMRKPETLPHLHP